MSGRKILSTVAEYDREITSLDDAQIKRMNAALDSSYQALERDLRVEYPKMQSLGSLTVLNRKLLIQEQVKEQLNVVSKDRPKYESTLLNSLRSSTESGVGFADTAIKVYDKNFPIVSFSEIPIDALAAQARSGVERLMGHGEKFAGNASAIIEQSLVMGSSVSKVTRALREQLKITKTSAETIARTEIQSAFSAATASRYQRNGVNNFQWIITPSEGTCIFCSARNGSVYQIGTVFPPHPRCRCMQLPWTPQWSADGITEDEFITEYFERGKKSAEERGLKLNFIGPTPFEKAANLTRSPTPIWKPGDPPAVPAAPRVTVVPIVDPEPPPVPEVPEPEPEVTDDPSGFVTRFSGARKPIDERELRELGNDRLNVYMDRLKTAETLERPVPEDIRNKRDSLLKKLESLEANPNSNAATIRQTKRAFTRADRAFNKAKGTPASNRAEVMEDLRTFLRTRGGEANRAEAIKRAGKLPLSDAVEAHRRAGIRESVADMEVMTNGGMKVSSIVNDDPRAYYLHTKQKLNIGKDLGIGDPGVDRRLIYHEMAHSVEYTDRRYLESDYAFIRRRANKDTTGNPVIGPIQPNTPKERGYSDDWITPYVGKYYRQSANSPAIRSTEVLSMGIERFASGKSMEELYSRDPEHFSLVLGILEDRWLTGATF